MTPQPKIWLKNALSLLLCTHLLCGLLSALVVGERSCIWSIRNNRVGCLGGTGEGGGLDQNAWLEAFFEFQHTKPRKDKIKGKKYKNSLQRKLLPYIIELHIIIEIIFLINKKYEKKNSFVFFTTKTSLFINFVLKWGGITSIYIQTKNHWTRGCIIYVGFEVDS